MFKHIIKGTNAFRNIFLLFTLLATGATGAWAQTDYSGVYYLGGPDANSGAVSSRYYLCPTENWINYEATNNYTYDDNGQPFLTTYQCRNGVYDANKAIWIIEKHPTLNYYYIKHAIDGKYLTYNGQLNYHTGNKKANIGRLRIHLQDTKTDDALFRIDEVSSGGTWYEFLPKTALDNSEVQCCMNVTNGNNVSLAGASGKKDGPDDMNVGGTIGLWRTGDGQDRTNNKFYIEEAILPPELTVNADGSVSMSAESGYEVRYTTDGTTPTASSTLYESAISHATIAGLGGTTIKAVAVKTADNTKVSNPVTLPLVTYTYNVVNQSTAIAIQYTIKEVVGKPLSGYSSIPEEIRSPYISDETVDFYSFTGALTSEAIEAADPILKTTSNPTIYITYTNTHLDTKILYLRGSRALNIRAGVDGVFDYIFDSGTAGSGTLNHESTEANKEEKSHLWYISGLDPYALQIRNAGTNNYLHYDTPSTLSLGASASPFILMDGAADGDGSTYEQIELMAATGGTTYYRVGRSGNIFNISTTAGHAASLQVRAYPSLSTNTYNLIDRAGDIIASVSSTASELELPAELWSPLVTYHYYTVDPYNRTGATPVLKSPAPAEMEDITDAAGTIYVTYDVHDDIDLTGGKTYLLKFLEGITFNQENGSDGINGTASKAIYPYNNGDFGLYVYGQDEWDRQLSNGASTRTRWLWYFVSNHDGEDLTGDAIDPYHVIIKSRQNQSYKVGNDAFNGNAYLRTFKPNSDVGVVTSVITQHDPIVLAGLKPTEYMLIGSDIEHLKLKTVDAIDGSQRVVNAFEQYWKNNPTVMNILKAASDSVVFAKDGEGKEIKKPVTYELTASQKAILAARGWHTYESWAYAAPWSYTSTGGKTLAEGNHWYQTISMGSGAFAVEEVLLEPQVILLDQHGWEIVRIPMSQTAQLRKYNSPMVEQYKWYPNASKVSGYHKFEVSNQEIIVYDNDGNATAGRYTHNSTDLADIPYDHSPINTQIAKVKTDFYVTYTVKTDYASTYAGAALKGDVRASSFLLKQGGRYAKLGDGNTLTTDEASSLTGAVPANMQWKVKPNFDIDKEMGYKYQGEAGAQPEADSKYNTELAYVAAEKNGFDPYNIQIQSVANPDRYFKTNTASAELVNGVWTGTSSSTITLRDMGYGHVSAHSYEVATLDITNATFMVVDDGNGNMRLMPRFDNTKVMTSFNTLATQLPAAAAGNNGEGTQSLTLSLVPTVVSSTDEILSMKGYYILADGFELNASIGTASNPFQGTIDGNLNTFSSYNKPLVAYADGATIRNVILDGVTITTGNTEGNAGAIVATAMGASRIYNCGVLGSEVGGTNYVGGIVGLLGGSSRVINCYSYADITGGSVVGGIVGYNSMATTANDIKNGNGTMVMNCAFYGDITGGSTKSPVYGGENIANTHGGLNNYNYYAYSQLPSSHLTDNKYNTALAVADEDFQRFEFYRLLLNSNKKLAAYYITGDASDANILTKWVLETADRQIATPKAYPVLKQQDYYPSIINMDVENAPDSATVGRNKGGKLGKTLSVTISGVGTNAPSGASLTETSLTLDRTDKDFERYNFNYDKVQLPYYNDIGEGNYTKNKVVTGWEIIDITAVAGDPYTSSNYPSSGIKDYPDHNYADRKSSNKDKFDVSGRIFSQGAYFDVPYGVTSITIRPHWATAVYVADEYLDVVYNADYNKQVVTAPGNSFKQFPTGKTTINGSEQTVYTSISSAISSFSKGSVYDYAVVLVGNLHQDNVPLDNNNKTFTMMSVDLDNDHEPDYSMIYHHTNRTGICPIRFDFLNVIGTAYAQKPNGASLLKNTTIFKTRGWFEVTNTALMYSNQMEYENIDKISKEDAPLILLGGKFDQFVSTQRSAVNGKTIYIHVGGNVWIDQFGLGTHSDGSTSTPHVPVSVTGGEYNGFYLTGTYNQDAAVRSDNAECYISGGHFVEAAGACQEAIDGNVRWQIYNADIDAFYGGGINAAKPIKGSITTEITNSYVTTFCGGPKFGDMQTGKDVKTTATGCVFERYFGAGFGGTSYSRKKYYDEATYNFNSLQSRYTSDRGKYYDGKTTGSSITSGKDYGKKGPGEATDFDYEFFVWSTGQRGARFFVKFASFSLANCIDVYSTLNNCTVNENFYGGGSFGSVSGTANSVLNNCTVHGNVFGGGYSATREKVPVRDAGFTEIPVYNSQSGMFEPGTFSGTTEYEWKHVSDLPANGQTGIEDSGDNHYLYTDVDLDALGKVGNTVLTIQGTTVVEGNIFQYDSNGKVVKDGAGNNTILETTGGVFGGGDMSAVNHNTQVNIEATGTDGVLNVFGGGNTADVLETTTVTMTGGKVAQDIYGGGKGAGTEVGGNVTVNLGTRTGASAPYTYTGDGLVTRNVYGGSALGAVNSTSGETKVNIYKGTVNGSVFGGGLGHDDVDPAKDIVAQTHGNATITVENSNNAEALVNTAVYGGANENGVMKGNTTVTITGGTVGTVPTGSDPITNVVFGGGFGEPTLVEGHVEVNIGTEGQASGGATVNGHVYGGGALGSVNTSKPASDLVFDASKHTHVNLYKGLIKGNVYGGGLGQQASLEPVLPAIAAYVGGDVQVLLDGAQLECAFTGAGVDLKPLKGQIFGCNNLNGTPKGHVKVWVKRTENSSKPTVDGESNPIGRDDRPVVTPPAYGYDVAAVYGGGNMADYHPTKADGTAEEKEEAFAEVVIEGCDLTSIEYVYGGGNAAAVPATEVTVKGTYIIDYVFGGGNGKGTDNPGADVGIINKTAYAANPSTGIYGTGKAVTKLIAGKIHVVYGGSNTLGNVRGGTSVTMPQISGSSPEYCSELDIREIYGAGQNANQDGAVNLILGCVKDMDVVYGGAKDAHVAGGINLTITSGSFKKVFGGNNLSGTIQGPITLNIEETACDPITIEELYLGGNDAAYSIYGYEDGTYAPRTKDDYDALTTEQKTALHLPYSNPVLNVISCTQIDQVFGGGKGSGAVMHGSPTVNLNMVPGAHATSIDRDKNGSGDGNAYALGTIGSVYGGGSAADVYGDATVNIGTATTVTMASVEDDPATDAVNEHTPSVRGARIVGNVYGGGALANVFGNTNINIGTKEYTTANYEGVSITGNVFGGGQGEGTKVKGSVAVKIGERIEGDPVTYMGNAAITGDVYGGSALGSVNADGSPLEYTSAATTAVTLNKGTITGSIYGGGLGEKNGVSDGTKDVISDVYGPVTVTVNNGTVTTSVHGCNNLNGSPKDAVTVNINGTAATIPNVYGGGNLAPYTGGDVLHVNVAGGSVNDVFGGGLGASAVVTGDTDVRVSAGTVANDVYGGGSEAAVAGGTSVTLSGTGAVSHDIYGGGKLAEVQGAVAVALNGGTVAHDVYGGGALAETNTLYDGANETYRTYVTNVTLAGATIDGDLYGGGLGRLAVLYTAEDAEVIGGKKSVGDVKTPAVEADVHGPVTVTVSNGKANRVFGCNNINGAPLTSASVLISGTADAGSGSAITSVFGGGNQADYTGNTSVTMSGGTADYIYGGGLGASAIVTGNTSVTISGGRVAQDVYGGGSQADVTGNVSASVSGGTVVNDVYGGGALANTNTGNWDSVNDRWSNQTKHTYYAEVKHLVKDVSSVSGYYTRSGSEPSYSYSPAAGTAVEHTKYYKKLDNFLDVAANGTTYKTTVSLTGGTIGNAYGGGLGRFAVAASGTPGDPDYVAAVEAVEAMVYGDVSVTVDGTKFTKETTRVDGKTLPVTGRVFGCNNKNGTPKGNVNVWVKQTKRLDGGEHVKNQFEIQAVYGGGNMADYDPDTYDVDTEFGQGTHVLIQDCGTTSIERVYGGGNASKVPYTEVVIDGSFQIGYAFGGGNGGDKINKGTGAGWEENPGADVTNYTNVLLIGGTIGDAFGGSDSKGTVGHTELTQSSGSCPLVINNVYGASKEADSNGDVILNLSGCGSAEVDKVFGGSYNANVRGSVTINITSGIYASVYGGNDRKGSVGGNITINVEEIDECNPIIIQNLFGGGSQADYPGTGAKAYIGETPIPEGANPTDNPTWYENFTSGTITLNVKAATRIDRIYGGCDNAIATGNTVVNINMVKGSKAGDSFTIPASYTGDPIPNISENVIDNAIGTIGDVYGGGNEGDVVGNTTVNICTVKDIAFVNTPAHLSANGSGKYDVVGAHIYGDVFGGGNLGEVTGNTTVNIGTADYSGTANFEGIFIDKNASGKGGSVYGGGNQADVLGNTNVTVDGGGRDLDVYVFNGIFGGGYSGSVGTFTRSTDAAYANVYGHTAHAGCIGKPISCAVGTGKCTVVVTGGQIGPVDVAKDGMNRSVALGGPVPQGWVWGGGCGLNEDPATNPDMHFKTYVGETDVTIGGTALIMESVIGGGKFGRVFGNTLVKIQDHCQIGVGNGKWETVGGVEKPKRYTDGTNYGSGATSNQFIDPTTTAVTDGNKLAECSHFPYGDDTNGDGKPDEFHPYDPYIDKYVAADPTYTTYHPDMASGSTANPSDGKTWIGCVFGGGSGYMPYEREDGTGYEWCRSSGWVEGNATVQISGGHILTNVYGGNEMTDVGGTATVTMTGGTIGVPRTEADIKAHPVTCYLFGGGKGDERSHFDKHTNVGNTVVNVSGGIIYGSVFGGSEDGHVLGDAAVTISSSAKIGTCGTSYVDGNVFGGGRGFSGKTLVAGSVGGNVTMTINGGTMLGSIYGGGRLASVGVDLDEEHGSDSYGQLKDETGLGGDPTYGHITINISGGTIGNASSGTARTYGGNVFGGCMGRITLLDGSLNPVWPKMAVAKLTNITISGGEIMNNVYGGSEYGVVRNRTTVNVSGGTIHGNVFGGGYGSDEQTKTTIRAGGYSSIPTSHYTFTPMIWTGCVSGETNVNISGGKVGKNVYGGGEFASVGLINFNSNEDGTVYNYITKHESLTDGFGLSWPYEFQYIIGAPNDAASAGGNTLGGKATVTITGGRIGTTGNTGFVFGGSKGQVAFEGVNDINEQRYVEAFCANVRETEVNINYASTPVSDDGSTTECIVGSVYGGGQDGHVEENAFVSITSGLIGQSVYGGGEGESTYKGKLRDQSSHNWKGETEDLYSWTAGKVYGNTSVSMTGGHVTGNIYGGGNLASVGKGNYAGGTDDYFPTGYGETLNGNLWTATEGFNPNAAITALNTPTTMADHFLSSGKATVTITGGTVGTLNGVSGTVFGTSDPTPTGMVFGGSRGRAAQDVMLDPRHEYAPNFYLGYVNNTEVTIGDNSGGPRIYSQVFGGGRDGHVRGSAHVTINNGSIGQTYAETTSAGGSTKDYQFYHRGNVYGSGSGLGIWDASHHGMSSGSVTRNTTVDIYGGTIHNSVYGGGALSSVGPPKITQPDYALADYSKCTVNLYGGTIGSTADYDTYKVGGCVYGASRGNDFAGGESANDYATVLWTEVNVYPHPSDRSKDVAIAGNVYGGAKGGIVWKDTKVNLTGGRIYHDAYGGGQGSSTIAANVNGNATVELNKSVAATAKGSIVNRIFGGNDLNGTPRGHIKVHVHGTQHKRKARLNDNYETFNNIYGYSIKDYTGLITLAEGTYSLATKISTDKATLAGSGTDNEKNAALTNIQNAILQAESEAFATTLGISSAIASYKTILDAIGSTADQKKAALAAMKDIVYNEKYDVQAVYGGGNLAPYQPYGPAANNTAADYKATTEEAEVIIDGCGLTSIRQVYGGGNAASTPANRLTVYGTHEIDELFGGGNGKDPYQKASDSNKWYGNPGANVGYYDYTEYVVSGDTGYDAGDDGDGLSEATAYVAHTKDNASEAAYREANYSYGSGIAQTNVVGGRVHQVYGGSNEKGNIRELALSIYETSTECPVVIDQSYGAGKNAPIDGEVRVEMECVNYMAQLFGGADKADLHNNVNLTITNGHFGEVYGGNNTSGHIYGNITVNVKEQGCKPIVIDKLYAGGYLAPYSIYGYYKDTSDGNKMKPRTYAKFQADSLAVMTSGIDVNDEEAVRNAMVAAGLFGFPKENPKLNIISATKIGDIYGGGNKALVIGNPHINVNMEEGSIAPKYVDEKYSDFAVGSYPVTDNGTSYTYVVDRLEPVTGSTYGKAILAIGTIDNIYGGGDQAVVDGNTHLAIGTGTEYVKTASGEEEQALTPYRDVAKITNSIYGGGRGTEAAVKGNTFIAMGKGATVENCVFGGGDQGSVGTVTTRALHTGDDTHADCIGKPTAFAANTGRCTIVVDGGRVGPKNMTMPTDYGYIFGASRGVLADPAVDKDIDFKTYVNETYVTIKNKYEDGYDSAVDSLDHVISKPLICGAVYGGSENGRVLEDTHVFIYGGQIGIGAGKTEAYAEADFINPATATASEINTKAAAMTECASWTYGTPWAPYDPHAADDWYVAKRTVMGDASTTGTDGHTFYGNVFGGGSGFFAYEKNDKSDGIYYEWLPSAGLVEGDTHLTISGGHILTSAYGGNEMTDVKGTCHVTMTGGTLGVPRTLTQIAAHPITCYLFGGGKGDQRIHFNKSTNVGNAVVDVRGGIIYGSVFGGGEDGHVLGDVKMTIGNNDGTGPTIGTWGTSYVDGNIFGGGRGFSGDALTAGNVAGSVHLDVKGGTMLGSVYGGGRLGSVGYGLCDVGDANYGVMSDDDKDDDGNTTDYFTTTGLNKNGRGNVVINISGGTIGNDYEYVFFTSAEEAGKSTSNYRNTDFDADYTSSKLKTADEDADGDGPITGLITEGASTSYKRIAHTKGGNVFGGGMGRLYQLDNSTPISNWEKLAHVKSTTITVTGGTIKSNVYGGSEMGQVEDTTYVDFRAGTIGSEVKKSGITQYTFGCLFGGGYGTETLFDDPLANPRQYAGMVGGNTKVIMSNGWVKASVYGGGKSATVNGNTTVNISGGQVGLNKLRKGDGYVMYGGANMGNVYGGGRGSLTYPLLGVVKGNTNVTVSGGNIYHMVYGGGALASVGTFSLSDGGSNPTYIPIKNVPYDWTDGTGTATVNIRGGVIGISGRDNGFVFGSSRGGLKKPTADVNEGGRLVDPYDRVAWVKSAVVNIGTAKANPEDPDDMTTPLIKGSVYGGGENGHNAENAEVNVYSGTIGIADKRPDTGTADPWWDFGNEDMNTLHRSNRGNVYGAGSGADTYTGDDGKEHYNQKSGMVGHNTEVNIYGGHVGHNVYGGGSMAMVGTITNDTTLAANKHIDEATSFALSWPYKFVFANNTGKATVNVRGGHIGTLQTDGGDVFGSSRGVAGDRYTMAHLAYVKETEVNINYPTTADLPNMEAIQNNYATPCITGAVQGSGENGYVYGDTKVTLVNGLIGHSLYGAGKGKGTYTKKLRLLDDSDDYDAKIYSLLAGKVLGNTSVTMLGGRVGRNIYGGGNMGSVGKGNYAGGADDYYPDGYGEKITGNLWDGVSENSQAFLNSGKTTVNVISGTVGYIDSSNPSKSMKNELPYGNVIGGSAGEAAPNIAEDPRYEYSPAFFSGYVNETDVTIGGYRCKTAYDTYEVGDLMTAADFSDVAVGDTAKWEVVGPTILASVYGGGQDGHVRRDTKVTVLGGEIGKPYTSANIALLKTDNLDDPQWLHRGNVYGGGSGITKYKYDFDGNGTTSTDANGNGTIEDSEVETATYNGQTVKEEDYSSSSGSVTRFTEVNILGGIIHRNVYGGGSLGSVGAPKINQDYYPYIKNLGSTATLGKQSLNTVNIKGTIGTPNNALRGWTYQVFYGGEVYGASRGLTKLIDKENEFSYSIWTKVNILKGAHVMGNVFGGGDTGKVMQDSEVKVGFSEAEP